MRKRSMITHHVAGILPEELMMEIIVRIPVRFLARLRFVCKSWNALITDPQFAFELCNKNAQQRIMFLGFSHSDVHQILGWKQPYDRKYVALFRLEEQPRSLFDINPLAGRKLDYLQNLNFPDCFKECIVAGSVNGIICLSSFRGSPNCRFIALWNPAITRWKPIHLVPNTSDDGSVGLAFDPLANDYKVIRLVSLPKLTYPKLASRVEVYSANQDSWSVVHSQLPFYTNQPNCSLIVKGVPNWSGTYINGIPDYVGFQSKVIASVDPHTGLYKKISYPQIVLNEKTSVHPFNLMDSPALLIYSPGEKPNQTFHVYALDDEHTCASTWINVFSTSAPTTLLNRDICILRCFEDAGKTVVVGWNHYHNASFLYNLKTDRLIASTGLDAFRPRWDESYHHVESLVCVPGMEPIRNEDDIHINRTKRECT